MYTSTCIYYCKENLSYETWAKIKAIYTLDLATELFRKVYCSIPNNRLSAISLHTPFFKETTIPVIVCEDGVEFVRPMTIGCICVPVSVISDFSYSANETYDSHAVLVISINEFMATILNGEGDQSSSKSRLAQIK